MSETDSASPAAEHWVDTHVASYRYRYPWAMLIFPVFGLFAFVVVIGSKAGIAIMFGIEALLILAFFQYRSYRVDIGAGKVGTTSLFSNRSIPLSDVDLIQLLQGDRGTLLLIRHGDRILLTATSDLGGFDDLVGFFREYARHHHLIFATRDDLGEWTQVSPPKKEDWAPRGE